MTMAADTVEAVLAGRPASFSWRALAAGKPPEPQDLRRFIQVRPVLDFNALQPGRAATEAISRIASDLKLDTEFQAHVRLTGQIPMDDDEFGTITQNAALTMTLSLLLVLGILWLALRSPRIILAVMLTLAFGLAQRRGCSWSARSICCRSPFLRSLSASASILRFNSA
jgi:uncharacterized protein